MFSEEERKSMLEAANSLEVRASFKRLRALTEQADLPFEEYLAFLTSFDKYFGANIPVRPHAQYTRVLL